MARFIWWPFFGTIGGYCFLFLGIFGNLLKRTFIVEFGGRDAANDGGAESASGSCKSAHRYFDVTLSRTRRQRLCKSRLIASLEHE